MGRTKIGLALVGVVVTLLGVVAAVTMRSDGSSDPAVNAAGQDAVVATTTAVAPAGTAAVPNSVPAAKAPSTEASSPMSPATKAPNAGTAPSAPLPAQPTAQDIQKVIEGITSQVLSNNTTASTKPLTKEEVEAQVREQLKQFGIIL